MSTASGLTDFKGRPGVRAVFLLVWSAFGAASMDAYVDGLRPDQPGSQLKWGLLVEVDMITERDSDQHLHRNNHARTTHRRTASTIRRFPVTAS